MLMQSAATSFPPSRAAVVSKPDPSQYLQLDQDGRSAWVTDPLTATVFPSMRDAMRMALRLPSGLRAYGLPLEVEVDAFRAH
ncbi:MAG: hypothetical protein WDM92_14060 [Caulobacteraceae bacterium]